MWVPYCQDVNALIWSWYSHYLGTGNECSGPQAFRVEWGLWLVCCLTEGAGFPSFYLGVPQSQLRAALGQRGGEMLPFADGSCLCNWRSKEWFQESKTRKIELLGFWEVGWPRVVYSCKHPGYQNSLLCRLNNEVFTCSAPSSPSPIFSLLKPAERVILKKQSNLVALLENVDSQ